jgi:hypothetical protein
MIYFFLRDFMAAWINFDEQYNKYRLVVNGSGTAANTGMPLDREEINRLDAIVTRLKLRCERINLEKSVSKMFDLEVQLNNEVCTPQTVKVLMQGIWETIIGELGETMFLFVPKKQAEFFELQKLFGIPSAKNEIKAAGECLAADLHTAAVFHLMRATEFGLRALAKHLDAIPEKWPIEFSQWCQVITDIENKLDPKIKSLEQMTKGHDKDAAQELYSGLLIDVRHIKVTRDRVMHTRETYNEESSLAVLREVEDFMCRLTSAGIEE